MNAVNNIKDLETLKKVIDEIYLENGNLKIIDEINLEFSAKLFAVNEN